jgi:hypothetical protein
MKSSKIEGHFRVYIAFFGAKKRVIEFSVPGGYRLRPFLHRMRGVKIGKNVWISQYVYIDELHPDAVTIWR